VGDRFFKSVSEVREAAPEHTWDATDHLRKMTR
jgi:hypothetical protein